MWIWLRLTLISIYLTVVLCQDDSDGTTPTPTPTVVYLTDSNPTYTWRASDDPSIKVSADAGYQIQVNITQLDVDGANDDYVIVRNDDDDVDVDEALMFTYTVTGQPSYLFNHNEVRADYIINGDGSANSYEILFSLIGEATPTTTEPPSTTTTEAIPTASPEENATLTVYLENQAAADYKDAQLQTLRKSIANMGIDYCNEKDCPLDSNITFNNVIISLIEPCPLFWENAATCANLTFSLPIVKSNQTTGQEWSGYQLNTEHLKAMWDTYALKHLNTVGLDIYEVPNVTKIFSGRLIVICIIIVAMVVLILIFRAVINKINKKRRRHSDAVSIIRQSSVRTSQLSLPPHYLQEVPPLFSNDFQRGVKQPYSDFNLSGETDPVTPPTPNLVNISNDDDNEMDADADA